MKGIAARQTSLANTMMANYNANYAAQSAILSRLTNMFTPIAQAGPDQQGFGPQELAALNTGAILNVSGATRNAQQAGRTALAGRGGGAASPLVSGIDQQIAGTLASRGAQTLAGLQTGITEGNYAQGRENWQRATQGLNTLAGEYNPSAYGGQAQSGYNSAFGMEQKIQEMKNQKWGAIAGGIMGLGKVALGAFTGGASLAVPGMSPLGGSTQTGGGGWDWGGIPMPGSSNAWGGG